MPIHLAEWLGSHVLGAATHFFDAEHSHLSTNLHSAEQMQPPATADFDKEVQGLPEGVIRVDLLNNNNSQYYGDFMLGKPAQHFTAVFDTGSGITWVPGSSCKDEVCMEHNRFASNNSHSFVGPGGSGVARGSIQYGTGHVKYDAGQDSLTFCDSHNDSACQGDGKVARLSIPTQPFGMSTAQTSNPFRILPFDGILGLAPSGSPGSVIHQLKAAKALPRNLLGVYLSEDTHRSGSIDFGGVETSHIAKGSPLDWFKIRTPNEWQVSMKDILVNGKPLHLCEHRKDGVCPAVVDTGSSLVTGPTDEIQKLLPEIRTSGDCGNLSKMPTISIQLVDRDGHIVSYPLTPEEYTLRSIEEVPGSGDSGFFNEFPVLGKGGKAPEFHHRCEPGIGVMDVPGHKWVIGDTFLRRYYSIYDDDKSLVGFVRSVHPDEATSSGDAKSAIDLQKSSVAVAAAPWMLQLLSPRSVINSTARLRKLWHKFL